MLQRGGRTPPADRLEALLEAVPLVRQRLKEAARDGMARVYSELDARLTFVAPERKVYLSGNLAGVCGNSTCPRGDLNPHSP